MAQRLSVLVLPCGEGPVGVAVGEGAVVAEVPGDRLPPCLLRAAGLSPDPAAGDEVLLTLTTSRGPGSFRLPRPLALLRRELDEVLPLPGFLLGRMLCRGAAGVVVLDDGTPALLLDAASLGEASEVGAP